MSDEPDIWTILDTYFRDSPYYKSQHQVDSYDQFIYSSTNGIQHIIQQDNLCVSIKMPKITMKLILNMKLRFILGNTFQDKELGEENLLWYLLLQNIQMKLLNICFQILLGLKAILTSRMYFVI